ncbi:MAG: formate dehydrogenase accessory sulfurtransferase FdhD [Chloroflexota bacterium]|nr:formate dehydrogenase accessory sulfurtransferase FdhD [Chloroflexota bacterium]
MLTIQTTPVYLDDWVAGFLFTKGLIHSQAGLLRVEVKMEEPGIDVELKLDLLTHRDPASKRYLTSGCGKGITFSSVKDALLMQSVRHALTAGESSWLSGSDACNG